MGGVNSLLRVYTKKTAGVHEGTVSGRLSERNFREIITTHPPAPGQAQGEQLFLKCALSK